MNNLRSSNSIPRSTKQKSRTKSGNFALNAISRFSTDIAVGVRNRYTRENGIQNLASDVSRLMSVINTEDKQVSTNNAAITVTNAASSIINISGSAQGAASNQRNGDSIKINRFDLEITFAYGGTAATATNGNQLFRYWLIRYKKTPVSGGSTPFNISEFLTTDSNGNYSPMSLPNTDTNENFQVMLAGEKEIQLSTLSPTQLTYTHLQTIRHDCNFHQEYNGSLATNVCDNAVFFVCVALNGANTGGTSAYALTTRTWYIDN
jgi:hypothetical protein